MKQGIHMSCRHVHFEATLDLSPFSSAQLLHDRRGDSGASSSKAYKLHGVLVHQGSSIHSGHYFAFGRCVLLPDWGGIELCFK